jgi:uncharacterized glyoxalase superfamily protein PhnB
MSQNSNSRPRPIVARSIEASLTAGNLQRSRDWYRDVLGFEVDREYDREGRVFAIAMRAGEVRLLITQDDGTKGADRVKGEGFSLQLTTEQDIDILGGLAKQAGATLDMEPTTLWGMRAFRLRDPDGFRWTISSPRAT